MGRFSMKMQLANHVDVVMASKGVIPADQVRRVEIDGVVDSGATRLVLPTKVAEQLGLPFLKKTGVRYADGRRDTRDVVGEVDVTLFDRNGVFRAALEPGRDDALIGAVVMEDFDLLIDCVSGTLRPRDPDMIISELE